MDKTHVLTKTVPSSWVEPLDKWEITMRAAGLLERTIETRVRHVRQLARALEIPPSNVSSMDLLGWCGTRDWKAETRHAYYVSFRRFFRYLYGTENNPAAVLPRVNRPAGHPRPAPEQIILGALQDADDRERSILVLAGKYGLRACEIAPVHANDFIHDLSGLSLVVRGKGGVERILPLDHPDGYALLARAIQNGGYLLPGNVNGHLSPRWISKLSGFLLPKPWTLHTLRHRAGTMAYWGTRDIVAVRDFLGHKSVETTQRYVAPVDDSLRLVTTATRLPV